jgi:hypothetical protein
MPIDAGWMDRASATDLCSAAVLAQRFTGPIDLRCAVSEDLSIELVSSHEYRILRSSGIPAFERCWVEEPVSGNSVSQARPLTPISAFRGNYVQREWPYW